MSPAARRIPAAAFVLPILGAVPPLLWGAWGWLGTAAVAGAGAVALAKRAERDRAQALAEVAEAVSESMPPAPAGDLARAIASEVRALTARLSAAAAEGARREVALREAGEGVVLIDEAGLVEFANAAARALLHERVLDVSQRLAQPDLAQIVAQASEVGAPLTEEVTLRVPGARHALARAVPLSDGGSVLLLSDLSESRRIEQMRRDFVANVSHELKTPTAGIRALAEVAATALAEEDYQTTTRFIARLGTEAERLSKLVADLLDLSRVEAPGELELHPVHLRALACEAADRARSIADLKGLEVRVAGNDVVVRADAAQLAMAVQNLVDNAVRYSDLGAIEITITPGTPWVSVSVSDQGIGIPADELSRIFERFYRVDRARSRVTGGTGLGLAIVKHVVENHHGRVEVHSELGVGSTFRLLLPAPAWKTGTAA
jgi:two-component system sensor histidine kinase SenX3